MQITREQLLAAGFEECRFIPLDYDWCEVMSLDEYIAHCNEMYRSGGFRRSKMDGGEVTVEEDARTWEAKRPVLWRQPCK